MSHISGASCCSAHDPTWTHSVPGWERAQESGLAMGICCFSLPGVPSLKKFPHTMWFVKLSVRVCYLL